MPIMVETKLRAGLRSERAEQRAKAKKLKREAKRRSTKDIAEKLRRLGPYPMADGPYDDLDYDALTRRRLDWVTQRKRLLEEHQRQSKISDAEFVQARNNPTEEIAVDDPDSKRRTRKNTTRVRQSEAWRYKQLTPMQRQAEIEMELAWRSRTVGLGASISKYGAVGSGHDARSVSAALDGGWRKWITEAECQSVIVPAFIDCLAEPKTLREVERDRKLSPGNALTNYQRGLDAWCLVRGWTRRA